MIRELSVAQVIVHSAMMRLPLSWSTEDKLRRADETMEFILGLAHSLTSETRSSAISGGQRKGVNIGIEMVTDPALLCLHEPTSGLDSTSSMSVLNVRRRLANYFQPRGFTCPHKTNPADYYMDVIAGIVPREGHESFHGDERALSYVGACRREPHEDESEGLGSS